MKPAANAANPANPANPASPASPANGANPAAELTEEPRPAREALTPRHIVELGAGFVTNTLRYMRVPEPLVRDAAQDVFVVALHRLEDFEGRSSLRTWLYGICLRVALRYRRVATRDRREAVMAEPPEVSVAPEQEAEVGRAEWRQRLDAVLSDLDETHRMVFVLYEIERLSMKEVAEAIGCPLQTAYYRHQAARRRVLDAFEHHRAMEDA